MISLEDICNDVSTDLFLTTYRNAERKVDKQTSARFVNLLAANQTALGTILAVLTCCMNNDKFPSLDTTGSNERDALIFKMMVHAGSSPSIGTSIYDLILHGQYFVACPLIRVLREHATKAAFYSTFQQEAALHLKKGGRRDDHEVQLTEMKKRLNWDLDSETRTNRYLNKFAHADPLATYSNLPLPIFNERSSYTLFLITARELKIVIHSLGKALQSDILDNKSLANAISSIMNEIQSIDDNLDQGLLQLRSVDNLR